MYANSNNAQKPVGLRIIRLAQLPFSHGIIGRIANYSCFFVLALWWALRVPKPEIVITMTSPPLISIIGTLLKGLRGARHFIWEMDVYPDIAIDLGFLRQDSIVARILCGLADAQRHLADGVIALGECMRDRLLAHGVNPRNIHVADNWADGGIYYPRPRISKSEIGIIYPGNFGLGHDVATLLGVLPVLETSGRFRFTFIGGGSHYAALRSHCGAHKFQSVVFKPYCAPSELANKELPASDIGLILQASQSSGSIVPSKLYPMLASGLPVLFIGPASATPARVINRFGCGWHLECGDIDGFLELLGRLADSPSLIENAGLRARQAFTEQYDVEVGVGRIFAILGLESRSFRTFERIPRYVRATPMPQ